VSETERDHTADHTGEPSPRVAAAAIRDAIEALEAERLDLAERLGALAAVLEADTQSGE
jgi:hypothetical protein